MSYRPPNPGKPRATSIADMQRRQLVNLVLFLGPAIILLFGFFILPVLVDIAVAFTDMGRDLRVTGFTLENFERIAGGDFRLTKTLTLTFVYVLCTLAIFNVTFGLVLALVTTSIPDRVGSFFRAVWLLPRMSPSVVYALLWFWVIDASDRGLINQILVGLIGVEGIDMLNDTPMMVIVIANGFIGASMGMIIFTSAIRSVPQHLYYAASADGAGRLAQMWFITLPAIRWPLSFITVYQTLSLLVSFEYIWLITGGGPFFDTTVYALYVYQRAFESGQYAYGAALALVLVIIGIVAALAMWRFFDMKALLQDPKIEVQ